MKTKFFSRAALAAMALMGTAVLASAPAKADVGFGISFGYNGGYFSDPCDYYDYYDQAPPWGMPPDYCDYPVYFEPVYFGGNWYRGPIYYRWYGGERMYWLNGSWRRDEWRGSRPSSIRWTDRGGWRGRDGWNRGAGGWGNNGWGQRDFHGRSDFRGDGGRDGWNRGGDRRGWGDAGRSYDRGNPGYQGGGYQGGGHQGGGYQGGGHQGGGHQGGGHQGGGYQGGGSPAGRGGWSGGNNGGGHGGQSGGQGGGRGGEHGGGHH